MPRAYTEFAPSNFPIQSRSTFLHVFFPTQAVFARSPRILFRPARSFCKPPLFFRTSTKPFDHNLDGYNLNGYNLNGHKPDFIPFQFFGLGQCARAARRRFEFQHFDLDRHGCFGCDRRQ